MAVARAIELGPDAVQTLKELGKGYTPQKDAAPRELPSASVIVEVIDALPADWQGWKYTASKPLLTAN